MSSATPRSGQTARPEPSGPSAIHPSRLQPRTERSSARAVARHRRDSCPTPRNSPSPCSTAPASERACRLPQESTLLTQRTYTRLTPGHRYKLGTAPHGTATSGLRRDPNPSSCRRYFASSGTSNGWNDWPHSRRHPRRPQHERPHRGTGEMERCAEAQRLRTVACPLGSMRGLNRSPSRSRIPASPSSRARAPVMTGEAPSARAASVSLRSRAGRAARGRAVPTPVSVDRTRGNDAGTEPAPVLRGTTEGTKRCPDSSTACN